MRLHPPLARVLGTAGLLLSFGIGTDASSWQANIRQPASASYQGRSDCPALCSLSGPTPSNWTAYNGLDQIARCTQTVFYHVSLYDDVDNVDNSSLPHRFYACTSYGAPQQVGAVVGAGPPAVQTISNATFTFGGWNDSTVPEAILSGLSLQMRLLLDAGYTAANDTPLVLFVQSVSGTAGLYVGKSIQAQLTASSALLAFETALNTSSTSGNFSGSAAMQLCERGYDADHIFGLIAISNTSFTPVQQTLQSWANATCLTFAADPNTTQNISSTASFTTPLLINGTATPNTTSTASTASTARLARRGDCTTEKVISGDSCASLATKCDISASDFTKYNPSSTLCASLTPGQHVCCSAGTLPDLSPKPNSDGSCATYTIVADDTCAGLATSYDLTADDIESYNKNTWAWNGCSLLYIGNVICLSSGTPPMPAPLANAVCGPQKPGTAVPASGTANISALNPCPLNACCDVWGQCGITSEFCTDTNTGAPGTAKPGTNGCISNCGTSVVKGGAPAEFISLAYYEGYGMDRSCLYQDVRQIDTSQFSHLHFSFGVLSSNYSVSVGDGLSTYEFNAFKGLTGVKRVLSFGGWAFSTDPSTYSIFRDGVTSANRLAMATSIANFITENDLDGVDIDWEYPGAPDIPGIPAGSDEDGTNYLYFLVVLKNLLPGKTVSIAAPASYWYLKAFPIAEISKVVDYIVFMTYDLHGQWDAGNQWSQEGCSTGTCLRSHVNLTETMSALAMITKAGAASNKVVVGVSSYGRSFAMADAGCYGPQCVFTGTASQSNAAEGPCTGTAGYISDAEINDIVTNNASRVNQNFLDVTSNSRIVVYDDVQWVATMDSSILSERQTLYKGLELGGTTNWASDLETYNDAPSGSSSWAQFRLSISTGIDPYAEGNRTGNWTSISCDDPAVENLNLDPDVRWAEMDAPDAWTDVINVWTQYDSSKTTFTESVSDTIHGPEDADCGSLLDGNNCQQTVTCATIEGSGTGAAGYEIWNSMVIVHEMYASYQTALTQACATSLDPALDDFEVTFAPVPPPPDDTWLSILLDVVTLVGTVAVANFFEQLLKDTAYFLAHTTAYDNYKLTAGALVGFSTTLAKTLTGTGSSGWTAEKQDAFSDYMGQVAGAWGNLTEETLKSLFNGSDSSVSLLTSVISDGKMIEGGGYSTDPSSVGSNSETLSALANDIAKGFFAYAIATVWPLAGTHAFVLDSGYDCGAAPEISTLTTKVMTATGGCYNGKQYYLVYPSGGSTVCSDSCSGAHCQELCKSNTFSAPPGLDTLDGSRWGGVTITDLIAGSVRSYVANGNANGGPVTDPTNDGSLNDLMNIDITTPGFIRLPVCSSDEASTAWRLEKDKSTPNWPCFIKPSINDCGTSSFTDTTSDASPTVNDCMGIVNNIKNTQGQWEVENAIEKQHQIVQYGSCKFGVQGKKINGNIDFHVGAQDIVDIITNAITQFGGDGQIGAKGYMNCNGDVGSVPVEWGLY